MMQFGVFDHLDRNSLPLREYYEQRLKVIEAFDRAGFYAYHVAEHHFTPLGMAPSPSVFLAAVAQRTKRLRFGTFVYALPTHHPLRVMEEICMLDHMSGGRVEIGFGRGSNGRACRFPRSAAADDAAAWPRPGVRSEAVPCAGRRRTEKRSARAPCRAASNGARRGDSRRSRRGRRPRSG